MTQNIMACLLPAQQSAGVMEILGKAELWKVNLPYQCITRQLMTNRCKHQTLANHKPIQKA